MATGDGDTPSTGANMAQDDPQRNIFPFFDLPRELRDEIYDEMLLPWVFTELPCGLDFAAEEVACPELMTVSRQFASEYKDRELKWATAILTDRPEFIPSEFGDTVIELPKPAESIRVVRIDITDRHADLEDHYEWISAFAGVLSIKALSINVHLSDAESVDEVMPDLTKLTRLSGSTVLAVYLVEGRYDNFDFDNYDEMILKWTSEKGLFERGEFDDISPDWAAQLEKFPSTWFVPPSMSHEQRSFLT